MHIVFGRFLKYFLWFVFAVILGSFLIWFAKFGFNAGLYIDYLNGIEVNQMFQGNTQTGDIALETGSDLMDFSGDNVYDPSLDADIFGQTGVQQTGAATTWSTTTETFGFLKDSTNTWETLPAKPISGSKATIVSSWSAGSAPSADKLKAILDLAKKEQ